jgi:hypothetical protein
MVVRTLREFSAPRVENIRTGPTLEIEDLEFELKPSLINMVQATQSSGKVHEDVSTHLQNFLEIGSTIAVEEVNQDIIQLRLFQFSLVGRVKQWFYANKEDINTWVKCSKHFLEKFFPIGKTNALRGKITNFQQHKTETISEAWERLQGLSHPKISDFGFCIENTN